MQQACFASKYKRRKLLYCDPRQIQLYTVYTGSVESSLLGCEAENLLNYENALLRVNSLMIVY